MAREIVPHEYIPGTDDWVKALRSMTAEQYRQSEKRESGFLEGHHDKRERRVNFRKTFDTRLEGIKTFIDSLPDDVSSHGETMREELARLTEEDVRSPEQMLGFLKRTFAAQDEDIKGSPLSQTVSYSYQPKFDSSDYTFGYRDGILTNLLVSHPDATGPVKHPRAVLDVSFT